MKEFIVMMAMLLLGLCIYELIAVGDHSILHSVGELWQQEIGLRSTYP